MDDRDAGRFHTLLDISRNLDLSKPRFEIGRRGARHGDPREKSKLPGAIVFSQEPRHAIIDCRERASWKASLVHVERRKRGIWSSLVGMRLPRWFL
jgi:hypothetical protein